MEDFEKKYRINNIKPKKNRGSFMQLVLVFALIFALLVAIFAISNANEVVIRFPWGNYPISQALVILGSAAIGSVVVLMLGVFSQVKSKIKMWEYQGKIKKLEKELKEVKEQYETVKKAMEAQNAEDMHDEGIPQETDTSS
ncbi:DUF1049 domain-containing protein [Biomaibacter acetigenes]|jgi:uncharacterized integral membrane protein|uniref:DUF1049 domain-containing protein n=2 Tax=Biomaibacter acetigenes TaxID=2316383 RepID=A0A3G2R6M2_9FIRM|nr:DUF1049 domain-containing protein [Biomaibacter acetigenes]RKL64270.1 DUF1049 domain-containing protein [Thermoanaerobacteraceae bacterium SP2]